MKNRIDNGPTRIPIRFQINSVLPKRPFVEESNTVDTPTPSFQNLLNKLPVGHDEPPATPASILKSNKKKSRLPSEGLF